MGNVFSTDEKSRFRWDYSEEPHLTRRIEILRRNVMSFFIWNIHRQQGKFWGDQPYFKKYPEIKKYMRSEGDRRLVLSGICILFLQFFLAYWAHCQVDSLSRLSINCFVGNWAASILLFHMHEAAHSTVFGPNSVFKNRLFGFVLNLGVGVPFFSFFKKHHKNHHKYIGDQILDAEYPSELEAKIFPNNFAGKFCWLIFQPFIYTIRTPLLVLKYPEWWWDLEEYANLIFITLYAGLCFVSGYPYFWSHCALSAMAASCSNIFGYWGIMSHTEFFPMRETFSYYGYLNKIFMNFGYHIEHHDFPNIPGRHMPEVHRIAKEYYEDFLQLDSFHSATIKYLFDPKIGVFSRVKRDTATKKVSYIGAKYRQYS